MGIVDRLWRAIYSPQNNTITTGQGLEVFLREGGGSTIAGVSVNEDNVLQIADVWKVTRILAEDVGKLPLVLMKRKGKLRDRAIEHPSWKMIHTQPNPFQTKIEFWEHMMLHLLTRGNAFALMNRVTRQGRKYVTEMLPIHPSRVSVKMLPDFSRVFTITREGAGGGVMDPLVVGQDEMFHLPGLSANGYTGLSLVALLRETLGGNRAATEHGAAFFGNGAKPSVVFQMDEGGLSDNAYKRLKSEMNDGAYQGRNAYKALILEEGLKVAQMSLSQEDAQFVDTRKLNRSDVAGIWRVPPHMMMDLDRATFNNIEQLDRQYVTNSLMGWLVRIEARLHMQVLGADPDLFVKHNVDALLRGNPKDRAEAHHWSIIDGWRNRNEVRDIEDLDPGPPELDEYLEPQNMRGAGDPAPSALPAPVPPGEGE